VSSERRADACVAVAGVTRDKNEIEYIFLLSSTTDVVMRGIDRFDLRFVQRISKLS